MTDDAYLTDVELAQWLRVSRIKLQQDRSRGLGPPYVRIGRAVRYHVGAVRAWLASQSVGGAA